MTDPGRPTLGKSERRAPVQAIALAAWAPTDLQRGTSGVAEIAENKFYVAKSAAEGAEP
jgi:hypothetical protein